MKGTPLGRDKSSVAISRLTLIISIDVRFHTTELSIRHVGLFVDDESRQELLELYRGWDRINSPYGVNLTYIDLALR